MRILSASFSIIALRWTYIPLLNYPKCVILVSQVFYIVLNCMSIETLLIIIHCQFSFGWLYVWNLCAPLAIFKWKAFRKQCKITIDLWQPVVATMITSTCLCSKGSIRIINSVTYFIGNKPKDCVWRVMYIVRYRIKYIPTLLVSWGHESTPLTFSR